MSDPTTTQNSNQVGNRHYDMLLRRGRLFDPSQSLDRVGDIAIKDGKIAAIEDQIDTKKSRRSIDLDGLLVCPGLIDLHVHCSLYRNPEALDPNATGVYSGVTRVVDPGDSGAYNFQGFRKQVIEHTHTKINSWLSAVGLGGFMYGLYNTDVILNPSMIDVDASVNLIKMFPDIIRGIKTYCVPEGWGNPDGTEIYQKAMEIADLAQVALYIHTGSPSPDGAVVYGEQPRLFGEPTTREHALTKMLERLRPGDTVAHVCSNFHGTVWNWQEKRLAPGAREAYDRGVNFDSGRGAHFIYDAFRALMDLGMPPTVLSTDRHASDEHDEHNRTSNIGMCVHMSEFMALGMSLEDVVLRTTHNPAKALRLEHKAGSLRVGRDADISVLVQRDGDWTFHDSPYGGEPEAVKGDKLLSPVITVLDGDIYPCNPAFLPGMEELQLQEDVWSWLSHRPDRPFAYGLDE